MYFFLMLLAGILQAAMISTNGQLSNHITPIPVSLIVHLSGGLLLVLYILLFVRKKIVLKGMPWYLYTAGFFGVFLVSVTSFCVAKLGAAVVTCLSISGQLMMSAVIDHFGLFHMPRIPFNKKRIPGFLLIFAGILLLNLI